MKLVSYSLNLNVHCFDNCMLGTYVIAGLYPNIEHNYLKHYMKFYPKSSLTLQYCVATSMPKIAVGISLNAYLARRLLVGSCRGFVFAFHTSKLFFSSSDVRAKFHVGELTQIQRISCKY